MTLTKRAAPQLFVADDKFPDVIVQLQARGWKRFPHESFPKFDLKWSNYAKIQWTRVGSDQIVNHFHNAIVLSRKDELTARLHQCEDVCMADSFFARTFDLQKHTELERVAVWFAYYQAVGVLLDAEHCAAPRVAASLEYLKRVLTSEGFFNERLGVQDLSVLAAASTNLAESHPVSTTGDGIDIDLCEITSVLDQIRAVDPQLDCIAPGRGDVWICKPSNLSQGRGIHLVTRLDAVARLIQPPPTADTEGSASTPARSSWVVQKYIERPLLLQRGRKFDIRQWVLITSLEPLTIYWYDQCYLRFCSQPFALDHDLVGDSFVHLSNYSVQKHAPSSDASQPFESMWPSTRLQHTLKQAHGRDVWTETIVPQMQRATRTVIQSALSDMKQIGRGFEWLGIDFLLDDSLRVWLLEVNVSPDVSHSTPVTAALVPEATRGVLDIVLGPDGVSMANGWVELPTTE